MGNVIDVDERESEPPILTETIADGLFGGALLHDRPLASYLDEAEQPRYVLRNKKRGLAVDRDGEREQVTPDDDYQAVAVVTDVRVVVAVGQAFGDAVTEIQLLDVVDASATDGLVSGKLRIKATDDTSYVFACRGDLTPVADYVDGTSQAWVRAYRLLDDADGDLDSAADHLADDEFSAALDAVERARSAMGTARDRLADVGDGALAAFDEDSAETRTRVREFPRTIHSALARDAHADGRARWREGEYERAYDRLETAITAYREATRAPGDDPPDDELDWHREEAESELAELRRTPLARAQQVAQGAVSIDGPAPAAARWETAIERYREALWLDWGRDERRFDGDPEPIREAIVDAVDNLVTERRAAARACRDAARDHRMTGATDAARAAYRTALAHVDRARSVVDEVAPGRETGLEDTVAAIEAELDAVDDAGDSSGGEDATEGTGSRASGRDLTALVADYWSDHGWSVERGDGDLIATCDAPVELRAAVRVLDTQTDSSPPNDGDDAASLPDLAGGDDSSSADALASTVEECDDRASSVDATLAVVATVGTPPEAVRERAAERGVHLQDLRDVLDDDSLSLSGVEPA